MKWNHILFGKWNWKRPFISLASIYALLAISACSFADRIIFQPPRTNYGEELEGLTLIHSENEDSIAAIHLKAPKNAPTIIYSHGNAEDIGQNFELFREWRSQGIGVIAYDYPGYGLSPGKPTEKSTQQAIERVWNYAIDSGIAATSIVIVGRSIGSGPSVWLTSSTKPAGLILISPLKSAFAVAMPIPILPGDRFPNLKRIKKIETPLLVIHGVNDKVIPSSHGKALYENSAATNKSLIEIPNAGHNDLFYVAGDEILKATSDFINQVTKDASAN
ncbi:MAG: alpha/beta hydrolase [Akkermansiaceae bacterium]